MGTHDADGDGYEGAAWGGTDCDDDDARVHPGAAETCATPADDDCDGDANERDAALCWSWSMDADGDGYGDPDQVACYCDASAPYVTVDHEDCDDVNAGVHPGAVEGCDGLDDDCDGHVDNSDLDEVCDGMDNDCDGLVDNSGLDEVCDGFDNDCNGLVDDGPLAAWYADADGDGYGGALSAETGCVQPGGTVADGTDCDDGDPEVHPEMTEVCSDGVDQNCNGNDCGPCVQGELRTFTVAGTDFQFAKVCASTFQMGCTASQQPDCVLAEDEPVHNVTLTHDYWVGVTEVTQDQWMGILGGGADTSHFRGGTLPMDSVEWYQGMAMANAMSDAAGLAECYSCSVGFCTVVGDPYACAGYRLLTEAEWEGAARCGQDERFAGSNLADDVAWYVATSTGTTHPVGSLAANECGLHDMSGNVWEWTNDLYGALSTGDATNPTGAASGLNYAWRGGAYSSHPYFLGVASRGGAAFDFGYTNWTSFGVRLRGPSLDP